MLYPDKSTFVQQGFLAVRLVVTKTENGQQYVLMQQRSAVPYKGKNATPGDRIEFGEDVVQAAARALYTQTGLMGGLMLRGMGSIAVMKRGIEVSSEDEFHGKNYTGDVLVPEGVSGIIPCTGPLRTVAAELISGLTSGMYYVGARTVPELWHVSKFVQITQASLAESHPHHLHITR